MHPNTSHRDLETDPRYPSGEWVGFFLQPGSRQRHWMVQYFEFRGGRIRGEGNDFVGAFHLSGTYDVNTGHCHWTKQYLGQHQVIYEGLNRGQGIVGQWEIGEFFTDTFHIWPKGLGMIEETYLEAETPRSSDFGRLASSPSGDRK